MTNLYKVRLLVYLNIVDAITNLVSKYVFVLECMEYGEVQVTIFRAEGIVDIN